MATLDLGDVTIAYDDAGAGEPPFLLVHGYTGAKLDFVDSIEHFADSRRVIAYDHRGHGDSTNTGDAASYTLDQLADDLGRFVDILEIDRFDLLGHSMGGYVAQQYTFAHPERVRSLVLMDTFAEPGTIPAAFVDMVLNMVRAQGPRAIAELFAKATNAPAEVTDRLLWKFERLDLVAFEAFARELSECPSTVDRLGTIACPCTVIVGENDTGLRPPADLLAGKITGSVLAVIPDAAHSPQDENRVAWTAAVDAHLARADAVGRD